MTKTKEQIQAENDDLQRQLAVAEKLEQRNIAYRLADLLHERLCHSDHTDHCSWSYESWENPGFTKKAYLNRAQHIIGWVLTEDCHFSDDKLIEFVKLILEWFYTPSKYY